MHTWILTQGVFSCSALVLVHHCLLSQLSYSYKYNE